MNTLDQNRESWNTHYTRSRSVQRYPDENLVRLIPDAESLKIEHGMEPAALDFGCGSGRHLKLLHEKGYRKIHGLDLSENSVKLCRKLYPYAETELLILDGSCEDSSGNPSVMLNYPDNYFSLIIMWGVLHYNEKALRESLLSEIRRVAQPGSLFLGTLRSTNDTHYKTNKDINSAPVYYFTESDAGEMLRPFCKSLEIGYTERTPVGRPLTEKIAHWIFRAVL